MEAGERGQTGDTGARGAQGATGIAWGTVPVVAAVLFALALAGAAVNVALQFGQLSDEIARNGQAIERNCRFLATLDQDIRLHLIDPNAHPAISGERRYAPFADFPEVAC